MSEEKLTYQEIKEREIKTTELYTDKSLRIYIKFHLMVKRIFTEKILWVMSWIPFSIIWGVFIWFGMFKLDFLTTFIFLISHMIFWKISGKSATQELIDDVVPELEMVIDVLIEIKEERLKK